MFHNAAAQMTRTPYDDEQERAEELRYQAEVSQARAREARNNELSKLLDHVTTMIADKGKSLKTTPNVIFINNEADLTQFIRTLEKDFDGVWKKISQNRDDCLVQLLSVVYPMVQLHPDITVCRFIKRLAIRLGLTHLVKFI